MAKGYLQDVAWVDFYDRPIVTCYADDIGYVVPMKHIVEDHLGLNWEKQREKLHASTTVLDSDGAEVEVNIYNPVVVSGYDLSEGVIKMDHEYPEEDIPSFSPNAEYLCLPIAELNLFLAQINISRAKIEVRENLYLYQKECMQVLHDYWFRGFAVNMRENPSRISSKRHDWCPREMSSNSLEKGCNRYAAFAQRQFDSRVNPEEIFSFCQAAICQVLDIESENWDSQEGTAAFLLAFMERAAFDILYFSIEANVEPDDLQDILERNIQNAWTNMGTVVLSVQSPFTPFPGTGRGSPRELV